jgi:hypothetical protein
MPSGVLRAEGEDTRCLTPNPPKIEDKVPVAILTLASALRDQNLATDGNLENIFSFYLRYLEAVKTGKIPPAVK